MIKDLFLFQTDMLHKIEWHCTYGTNDTKKKHILVVALQTSHLQYVIQIKGIGSKLIIWLASQ